MRFTGTIMLILAGILAQAQINQYKGPAIWIPKDGAEETFNYQASDSSRTPVGKYQWKWAGQKSDSLIRNAILEVSFTNGKPNGIFQMAIYGLQPIIESYDLDRVYLSAIGEKIKVTGAYSNGIPSGDWTYETSEFPNTQKPGPLLSYRASNRLWAFSSNKTTYSGKVDEAGVMTGKWVWDFPSEHTIGAHYNQGILTGIKINENDYFPDFFALVEEKLSRGNPEVVKAPGHQPWQWTDGFGPEDSLWVLQHPIDSMMTKGFQAYNQTLELLQKAPIFKMPQVHGTGRFFYPIEESIADTLQELSFLIVKKDSLLSAILGSSIFSLKRNALPDLDAMLVVAQNEKELVEALIENIDDHLKPDRRFLASRHLIFEGGKQIQIYSSHEEYVEYLTDEANKFVTRVIPMIESLRELREKLREEAALGELEEEWADLVKNMEENLRPGDSLEWVLKIWNNYVTETFADKSRRYGNINSINEQRGFIMNSLNYYEAVKDYFSLKEYEFITEAPVTFKDRYTRHLFNPYTGEYNIEEVVRKRFLSKIQNEYWPWVMENLAEESSFDAYQEKAQIVKSIYDKLMAYPDEDDREANRLNRRVRSESDMSRIHEMLLDH